MEIKQLTGESGNVATHPLKHSLPTHITFTGRYQTFQNDFNVRFIAYGWSAYIVARVQQQAQC